MRFIHYGEKYLPLLEIESREQALSKYRGDIFHKPQGLWISVEGEDDWKSWCEREAYNLGTFEATEIFLKNSGEKILKIVDREELLSFTRYWGSKEDYNHTPNWPKIAQKYDGMIIAPYVWDCRLDHETSWYYGWDCASRCIWNKDFINNSISLGKVSFIKKCYEDLNERI